MKTLIVYYTRTNTTKILAEYLAEKLSADLEQIIDKKNRQGALNWIIAGRDALRGQITEIADCKFDPREYDLVLIGTPVWGGRATPAIKAYLKGNLEKINKFAFFCTQGSQKLQGALADLRKFTGREPVAELWLSTKQVRQGIPEERASKFIGKLNHTD